MPRYIIGEARLRANLKILKHVGDASGVKILLAQKAFSCAATYPLCAEYLAGTTASSLFEAKHGRENFKGETHVFAPAFMPEEMDELLSLVDHIVFNSARQVALYGETARSRGVSTGIRVNPEVSVATTPAYDPCRASSRLGATRAQLDAARFDFSKVDGIHFHCLCEQGLDELKKVLAGFEARFGDIVDSMQWVNFGGGHHITRRDYDVDGLTALINGYKRKHPQLQIYLEPGEAIALDAGILETRVLEIQPCGADGVSNAILDASAACHMPDVLEMPYTPRVKGSVPQGEGTHSYRFGGPTCLAGDEIGTYSFAGELHEGDTVVFEDMAIYSMVKNNTFNGLNLPDIAILHENGELETLRRFDYTDFAKRLG